LSVAAVQVRINELWVSAETVRPLGTVGAVVSGVVTDTGADCVEALPAASSAATVKL
jgi:hypothetical protein